MMLCYCATDYHVIITTSGTVASSPLSWVNFQNFSQKIRKNRLDRKIELFFKDY